MRVIVTGGGTGGHIFPALALARHIKEMEPDSEFLYIGTEKGLEHDIVPKAGLPFQTIEVMGLKRKLGIDTIRTFIVLRRGLSQAKRLLREFKPDVVIGTGGYVCAPVVYTAAKMKIPTVIHEQNAIPGLTNKMLARYASVVAVSFPDSEKYFKRAKRVVISGNPRASEFRRLPADVAKESLSALHLQSDKKTVLVVGGSRGARPINEAVISMLQKIEKEKKFQLLYVTGQVHYEQIKEACRQAGIGDSDWISIQPFLYDMPKVLSAVDVIVGRAGATSLAEITSIGVPSILIPSPYVANNHQFFNANWLVEHGAALLIPEAELNGERLYQEICKIVGSAAVAGKMADQSRDLGYPHAAEILYTTIQQIIKG
ncbi:undecaprenyldiphospho-muramoylpentapeptide beta-N-acetylglucosaminyltransferase [Fodinisporobacter ferrooxydans]|uniref:UDP-N-acetylglucosamine--N-acetylmuramyl-(pentapeptide) pyrophosphoryl-undecaprenol N-acetylglucosamine transferase n=1 Tax=Fodinisporobacter ferrooxydans TaxID=2901836 RepID=A0ABY4CRC3_9BACL|nr:undecaprenyldiphospho-muramoylpentapeptide beta-N-acetylglucosaminyltransferase [Alicyclobacillaceae bacterium MYW30-H2]